MHVRESTYEGTVKTVSIGQDGWYGIDILSKDAKGPISRFEVTQELPTVRPGQRVRVHAVTTTIFEQIPGEQS